MRRATVGFIALAFIARLILLPFSYLRLNPFASHDAVKFAENARHYEITDLLTLTLSNIKNVELVWGSLLSPLFSIPGPSRVYAALTIALLGSLAAGNVYVIARRLHSHNAGIYAASAAALMPSQLLIQSTIVREAYVVFCLTSALNIATAPHLHRRHRALIVSVFLSAAALVRVENTALYILLPAVALVIEASRRTNVYEKTVTGLVASTIIATPALIIAFDWVYRNSLRPRRVMRTYGTTKYLDGVFPVTVGGAISFSWIAALYFYFAPFPWMITSPSVAVLGIESILTIAFAALAIPGAKHTRNQYTGVVAVFALGLPLAGVLYGLGNGNVGAVTRLRQQFVWGFYLFGGIGFAQTQLLMADPQQTLSNAWKNSRTASVVRSETLHQAVNNSAMVAGLRTLNRWWRHSHVSSLLGITAD